MPTWSPLAWLLSVASVLGKWLEMDVPRVTCRTLPVLLPSPPALAPLPNQELVSL